MTAARAQRGRPKGSGINDQQRLAEIARLIGSDPRMKPTTAIKALGVTDPSTIRRLRDKFNSAPGALTTNLTPGTPPCAEPAVSGPGGHRVAALKIAEPVKRYETKTAAAPAAVAGLAPELLTRPVKPEPVPVAALLFGFGLNAATAFFEQQLMIAQSVMKLPQVRDLVRHQIAFTEFMLNVASPTPGSRYTH